ncbi:MAG: hypothetical protein M0015_11110 [Betaproteobacteria bacterium]|nr:hypothetical protein [Betaproteobacteria bacterium]
MSRAVPEPCASLLEETVVLPGGAQITIALWRERVRGLRYRLCFVRGAACLVRYDNETPGRARRQLRGRTLPYEVRSVEQLRYDFERDVEAVHGAQP